MKKRILLLLTLAAIIVLFTGIIDTSYEFNDVRVCIKIPPALTFYFYSPDSYYELKNPPGDFLKYRRCLAFNEQLGFLSETIPFLLLQCLLTTLFVSTKIAYKYLFAIIDLLLFAFCFIILGVSIKYVLLNVDNKLRIYIATVLLLLLNYLTWNVLRNRILNRLHKKQAALSTTQNNTRARSEMQTTLSKTCTLKKQNNETGIADAYNADDKC